MLIIWKKQYKMKLKMRQLIDNFGDFWIVEEGEIKLYDYAFNHDTGDVVVVEYDDNDEIDLYYYNQTHTKVKLYEKNNTNITTDTGLC